MADLEIKKSLIAGLGVFAKETIFQGEVIILFDGEEITKNELERRYKNDLIRLDDDFQVGIDRVLVVNSPAYYINHCCDPNAGIRGERLLVAIRDIIPGEEVTYDYSTLVHAQSSWRMVCSCKSLICRCSIGSILSLPQVTLTKYFSLNVLPNFILDELDRRQLI